MYCEPTENFNEPITLKSFELSYDRNLILVFSVPNCTPCKNLSSILKQIYDEKENNTDTTIPNTIKINAQLLCDDDLKYITKYPTIYVLPFDQIKTLDEDVSILLQIDKTNKIIGVPNQEFFDKHNLTVEF
jgi:hypothetical protein